MTLSKALRGQTDRKGPYHDVENLILSKFNLIAVYYWR